MDTCNSVESPELEHSLPDFQRRTTRPEARSQDQTKPEAHTKHLKGKNKIVQFSELIGALLQKPMIENSKCLFMI